MAPRFQTYVTLQHGPAIIAVRLLTLVAAPLSTFIHALLTPVATLAENGVALAVETIHLVTLLTMSHWFGVTFETELSVTLVACFDRLTSMAIRLIALAAMPKI